MEKRGPTKLLLVSIVLLILGGVSFVLGITSRPTSQPVPAPQTLRMPTTAVLFPPSSGIESREVTVTRVIDGDTIEIDGGEKVRYIGVDTPETVDPRRPVACFGKEASEFNKQLVEGKEVILTKDISDWDKFGRLLRHVYLKTEDGGSLFVNDYLVRQGYAKASTFPPDVKFSSQFLEAQEEARNNKRGLWQKCS